MLHDTCIQHQNIMQTSLMLKLMLKIQEIDHQYKILNENRLSLNKRIIAQNQRKYNFHVAKFDIIHLVNIIKQMKN